MDQRNTKKTKHKSNKGFPYKSRISNRVNQKDRYAIVDSESKEVIVYGGDQQIFRLKATAFHKCIILKTKLNKSIEIIDYQLEE